MVQNVAVQRNADLKPCRARKMLKNAPTLAIGGADTAENEPPKVRQVSNKIRRNIGRLEWRRWTRSLTMDSGKKRWSGCRRWGHLAPALPQIKTVATVRCAQRIMIESRGIGRQLNRQVCLSPSSSPLKLIQFWRRSVSFTK